MIEVAKRETEFSKIIILCVIVITLLGYGNHAFSDD